MAACKLPTSITAIVFTLVAMIFFQLPGNAQMRQLSVDNTADNEIHKLSLYSPAEGYIAFRDWIGYTTDSGRTFTRKYITMGNVNFNGYSVNLTFGFGISGVKAFNQNNIIAYGDYGLVPSILYSNDGGNSFTLVYHSQYDQFNLSTGITDMIFPTNGNVGFAVDADRVLKTSNQGLSWNLSLAYPRSFFDHLEGFADNDVFAFSTDYQTNRILHTSTSGTAWSPVTYPNVPSAKMTYIYFLDANNGFINVYDDQNKYYLFKSTNGGAAWAPVNNANIIGFYCTKMKFLNSTTGYAIGGDFNVIKTLDGGVTWEPLPRDNNYSYLGYGHNDLQFLTANQLWAGGGHGFLEMSTNGGGTTLPKAYFAIDTTGFYPTNTVNLVNYSRPGYSYKWYVNNILVSSVYNTSYIHDVYHPLDTIKLVVSNGGHTDSAQKYQYCGPIPQPHILSFSPPSAGVGATVTITGSYLLTTSAVRFGSIPAASFTVLSGNTVQAVVGNGESGKIYITTTGGTDSIPGFIFLYPPPTMTSFSPAAATAGTVISIFGNFFNGTTAVSFGGTPAASFTIVSQTQLNAVVGAAGPGNIQVTTTSGTASLPGFTFLQAVGISSFTPISGPLGTTVTISGSNFSTIPSENIVFFGAVKAPVLSASATTLVVTVPAGASYLPITVTMNNIQASSALPFIVRSGSGGSFNSNSFSNAGTYAITSSSQDINAGSLGDIDGDGKIDVVTGNTNSFGSMSVFPNTSSVGNISFGTRLDIFTPTPVMNLLRDMNGDGLLDLVVNAAGLSIAQNISSPGNIAFGAFTSYGNVFYSDYGLAVGDIDGDGRPDVVSKGGAKVNVVRNTSTNGILSFENNIEYQQTGGPETIALADLDGDGKPEMIVGYLSAGTFSLFKNISIKGKIIFAPAVTFACPNGVYGMTTGDINGDGKIDIVFAAQNIIVFKNTSNAVGNFSFASAYTCLNTDGYAVEIADLDGDGKPDLVSPNQSDQTFSIFRNNGSGSTISFEPRVTFATFSDAYPRSAPLGDLDGDGKTDIALTNYNSDNFIAFRNRVNEGPISFAGNDTLVCSANPISIGSLSIPGYTYSWTSSPAGFTSNAAQPLITPAATTSYFIKATSSTGLIAKDTVVVTVVQAMPANTWVGSSNNSWATAQNWSSGVVPNECTAVIINSGTVVISSNVTIASLTINPGATITVSTGVQLTILH